MQIQRFKNTEIDKQRWDELNRATNHQSAVYNSSAYLDALSPDWEAIVIGDYEAGLALPKKLKLGLTIYANPPFLQKLTLIGQQNQANITAIGKYIAKLKLAQLSVSKQYFDHVSYKQRTNYIIDLGRDYTEIAKGYKSDARKVVKKNTGKILDVRKIEDYRIAFSNNRAIFGDLNGYSDAHFDALAQFLDRCPDAYDCYVIYNEEGAIVYSVLLLKDQHRYYYLLSGPKQEYKHLNAPYLFIDWFLQNHCNQKGKYFDFEGSDIPSVAFFFTRFNPEIEHYYQFYQNKHLYPFNRIIDRKILK